MKDLPPLFPQTVGPDAGPAIRGDLRRLTVGGQKKTVEYFPYSSHSTTFIGWLRPV